MERRARSCEPEPDGEIVITPLQRQLFGDRAHDIIYAEHMPKIIERKIAREQEVYNRQKHNNQGR